MVDAGLKAMKDNRAVGVVGPVKLESELVGDIGRRDGFGKIGKQADIPDQGHQDRALGVLETVKDGQGADHKIAAFMVGVGVVHMLRNPAQHTYGPVLRDGLLKRAAEFGVIHGLAAHQGGEVPG